MIAGHSMEADSQATIHGHVKVSPAVIPASEARRESFRKTKKDSGQSRNDKEGIRIAGKPLPVTWSCRRTT